MAWVFAVKGWSMVCIKLFRLFEIFEVDFAKVSKLFSSELRSLSFLKVGGLLGAW